MTRGELDVMQVNLQRIADVSRIELEALWARIERLKEHIAALDARLTQLEKQRDEDRS